MMTWIRTIVFLLAMTLTVSALAQTADAPDPEAARLATEISNEIYSPFCPGKTLAMCPSAAAAEVRMDIQDMAESGMSEDQIKQSILDEYGEEFRVVEPGAVDDVGPLSLLIGGLLIAIAVVFAISRRRTGDGPKAPDANATSGPKPDSGSGSDTEQEDAAEDPYTSALRDEYRG